MFFKFLKKKSAFTLVELLSVVAIISVLSAIIVPSIGAVMRSADAAKCVSNLNQIGSAFHVYVVENSGLMPGSGNGTNPPITNATNLNWFGAILGYVPMAKNRNVVTMLSADYAKIIYCPVYVKEYCETNTTTSWTMAGYGFNNRLYYAQGDRTAYGVNRTPFEAMISPSRTIVVGDSAGWMLTPAEDGTVPEASTRMGNPRVHQGRAHYLYLDGHVDAMTPDEAAEVLKFRQPNSS